MIAEDVKEIAERCKADWEDHFARHYTNPLPGDEQKRDGIVMGIDSLVEELLRFVEEEDNG